jgi:fluoride exporter
MMLSFIAVGLGGALGALLRWVLGLRFNAAMPDLPLGTLIANLSAGYVIGLAVAFFARYPDVPLEWRLFVITGILGGLSTFSTFSAEVTAHLQAGRVGWALGEIAVHVIGSVLMTMLGILTITTFVRR